MVENGNVNINHLSSSRGLHLNGKGVLNEKELLRQKKSIIEIMQSQFPKSRSNFWHNNFYQPNVNGMVFLTQTIKSSEKASLIK